VRAFVSQCDSDADGRITAEDVISMARANGSHRPKALALVVENLRDMIADIASRRLNRPVRGAAEAQPAFSDSVTWSEVAATMRERKEWAYLDEREVHAPTRIDNFNKHWVYRRNRYASLWILALSVCGFKAFVPIGRHSCRVKGAQQQQDRAVDLNPWTATMKKEGITLPLSP
ncbi:hypothetical protein FOZ62_017382, partial [Perkinsus olseni]